MYEMKFFVFLLLLCIFCIEKAQSKGKASVAVPKGKGKGKGNSVWKSFGQGVFGRVFREVKVAFCSELEALTLQITRPTDAEIPLGQIDALADSVNEGYEDPEFIIGILAKFSRKLCEDNVYTKIKSLLSIHLLMQKASDKAQLVILKCMNSLRSEQDNKVKMPFFSTESIERVATAAGNVAELQAVELAREYSVYLFDYLEIRGEKLRSKDSVNLERVEALMSLIEQGQTTEDCCIRLGGTLSSQCSESLIADREWAVKQLQKNYEIGITDQELEAEVQELLAKFDAPAKRPKKATKSSKITSKKTPAPVILDDGDEDDDEKIQSFGDDNDENDDSYDDVVVNLPSKASSNAGSSARKEAPPATPEEDDDDIDEYRNTAPSQSHAPAASVQIGEVDKPSAAAKVGSPKKSSSVVPEPERKEPKTVGKTKGKAKLPTAKSSTKKSSASKK